MSNPLQDSPLINSIFTGGDRSNRPVYISELKSLISAVGITLGTYLSLTGGTMTGNIVLPDGFNAASTKYVDDSISAVINGAPGILDTLKELADAIGDDANFITTVNTSIATKEPVINSGTTLQYWRGDKTWQALDTLAVSENLSGGLYFTNTRARASVSGNSPLSYNSSTGQFSITQSGNATNGYLSSTDWNTFNSKLTSTLTDSYIFVGNGGNTATGVAMVGDATIANTGILTLTTVNSNIGTFNSFTVNAKGLITAATSQAYLTGNQNITISGDGSGTGATSITLTLATVNSNVGSGFNTFTVNGKGLITAASTTSYLTGNQTITLSGDISGSGATSITTTIGAGKVVNSMIANSTIDLTTKVTGVLPSANGGTGVNNSSTITIGGAVVFSGAYSFTGTLTGTTSLTFPTSGILATTSNKLSAFAATTSAELAGVISDETGTTKLVFSNSPSLKSISLQAGTASATTAPLYFTSGTNLTTPEAGAVEFDGTSIYYTTNTLVRNTLATSADLSLKESLSNKATDFTTINDTLYPSIKAVNDKLSELTTVNGGSGVDFYFDDTASDISTYQVLNRSPESVAESTVTGTANNNSVLIKAYASPVAGIGGTQIDAGEWVFDLFGSVNIIGAGLTTIDVKVYKRTSGGTETLLFTASSDTLSASTELYTIKSIQQATSISATDRLVVKLYATTTAIINRIVTVYYGGSTHYSNFSTPLVIRHNDLSGLDGGQSGQYYHLTSAEYTGTGTGNFVRTTSPTLVTPIIGAATGTSLVLSSKLDEAKGSNITSASTVNIGAATGNLIHITGTTTITAFDTIQAGVERTLVFDGILTLTHNATTLILPSGTNHTTAAGDCYIFRSEGGGNWRCINYMKASSLRLLASNNLNDVASLATSRQNLRENKLWTDSGSYSVGSTTSETLLVASPLINTLITGDTIYASISVTTNNNGDTKAFRVYINTANTLDGNQVQIMIANVAGTSNAQTLSRIIDVLSNTTISMCATGLTNVPNEMTAGGGRARTTITVPSLSAGIYILITGQKATSSADTVTVDFVNFAQSHL